MRCESRETTLRRASNAMDELGLDDQNYIIHVRDGIVQEISVGHPMDPCAKESLTAIEDYTVGPLLRRIGSDVEAVLSSHSGDYTYRFYNVLGTPADTFAAMLVDDMLREAKHGA